MQYKTLFFNVFTLLAIFTNFNFAENLNDLLSWKDLSSTIPHKRYYLDDDSGQKIVIDGSVSYQVVVKVTSFYSAPQIHLMCHVNPLKPGKRITHAYFCRNNDNNCQLLNIDSDTSFKFGDVPFTAKCNSTTGAIIMSDWNKSSRLVDRPFVSGTYYCKFQNSDSTLFSANVEIQDIMRDYSNLAGNKNEELTVIPYAEITTEMLPLTLDCPGAGGSGQKLDDELQFNAEPLLLWSFCEARADGQPVSADKCLINVGGKKLLSSVFLQHLIHANGSLTIFALNYIQTYDKYALVCYDKRNLLFYHGIIGGPGSRLDEITPLTIDGRSLFNGMPIGLQDPDVTYTIREGQRNVPYLLVALYRANYNFVRAKWTKDGKSLGTNNGGVTNYQYSLGTNITKEQAGIYKLVIDYENRESVLQFTFRVNIKSLPSFKEVGIVGDKIVNEKFVIQGGQVDISMEYNDATSVEVFLNGALLSTDGDRMSMESSWNSVKHQLKLGTLEFNVEPLPLTNIASSNNRLIRYTATNLRPDDSHILTFKATNDLGSARFNKLIKVVPYPEFVKLPRAYNCSTKCFHTKTHQFECEISADVRESILATGAIINQSWYLGEELIREENKFHNKDIYFFDVKNETLLLLKPVLGSEGFVQTVRKKLSNQTVTCVVEIFDPMNYPPKDAYSNRLYDSRKDNPTKQSFIAQIRLTLNLEEITPAGISWIWGIIVVIVIILIIAALITYLALRSHEGATYLVDEQERAQGNDPEKEINEKEAFHTYEREDEYLHTDASRLSIDHNSVGIHSESDREAELYELDPGKFNEEGSFLYTYGNNGGGHR